MPYAAPPSESCLFLNVWTDAQQAPEKRPVRVWVYGGGFEYGRSSLPTYQGSHLAADEVVIVPFNYCLGIYGFLALDALDSEGSNPGDFDL